MKALVKHAGELLRCVIWGEIGAAHIADEERVAGQHRVGLGRTFEIGDQDRDAFEGVARRLQEAQDAVAEAQFVAIVHRDMRERGAGLGAQINVRAGERCQLLVAGNEIGVQVSFNHVGDAEAVFDGVFDVDADVALRIHHGGDAVRTDHVGSMGQASEIELLEVHEGPSQGPLWSRGMKPVKVI